MMIAVGFALISIGTISALCFYGVFDDDQSAKHAAAVNLSLMGAVCILIGITVWMWSAVP
jgi:fumarate reductase subunit D